MGMQVGRQPIKRSCGLSDLPRQGARTTQQHLGVNRGTPELHVHAPLPHLYRSVGHKRLNMSQQYADLPSGN